MKKFTVGILALATALPFAAHAQDRLTPEQLVQRAVERGVCGERTVVSAAYVSDTGNRVRVVCADAIAGNGGLGGLGGGAAAAAVVVVALAAAAAGGGGSTPDTTSVD